MVMYRVVEKVHVDRFITENNANYIVTLVLTLAGAVIFSHITKYKILPRVIKAK